MYTAEYDIFLICPELSNLFYVLAILNGRSLIKSNDLPKISVCGNGINEIPSKFSLIIIREINT